MNTLDSTLVSELTGAHKSEPLTQKPSLPWKQIVIQAASVWAAFNVILALLTYFATLFQASWANQNAVMTPHLLLLSWKRWDANYYLDIARLGYFKPEAAAFFPLYPLLIHVVTTILGPTHELIAAMLVSNLATFVAFVGMNCLVIQEGGDQRTAGQTLLVLAAYPLAFFLAAPYTEGVFLACALWALFAARRGWWFWAALAGFLGALSRPTGIVLFAPLVYEFGRQQGWWAFVGAFVLQRGRGRLRLALHQWSWRKTSAFLALAAAIPLGVGLFAFLCLQVYGDPLFFISIHQDWYRVQMLPWDSFPRAYQLFAHWTAWSYPQARMLVDTGPILLMIFLTLLTIRRMPVSFTSYMVGLIYLTIDSPVRIVGTPWVEFDSSGRFLLLSVPIFLFLGRWSSRFAWVQMLVVGGGFLLEAVFATYYLTGGWLI